jgi:hypothetical protein
MELLCRMAGSQMFTGYQPSKEYPRKGKAVELCLGETMVC